MLEDGMARLKLLSVALLSVLTVMCTEITSQVPNAEIPSWVIDLSTLGYPTHPSENFSKTFGVPPATLSFADSEHLVVTFISSDPGTPSEREGRPDSFRLRLHIVVFESRTGEVDTKRDWPTPNPNDGVVAGHDGKVVVRAGDELVLYDATLKALKETDTAAPDHRPGGRLFTIFSSPSGRFLLLEFSPSIQTEYSWMNADNLGTVHSFSENLFPQTISDTEVVGWRIPASRPSELVIRTPDEPGRVIALPNYGSNKVAFVREGTIAIESGYSPIQLVQTDGTLIESITPHTREYFSRITPSAEGHRFAFTGSRIRNTLEILEPHQTWEYVQRVYIYDMPTHSFVCGVKVKHSARNQDFPLALSPDGSTLAFLDGESLKVYRTPPTAEHRP
jgi:hypothetical protein